MATRVLLLLLALGAAPTTTNECPAPVVCAKCVECPDAGAPPAARSRGKPSNPEFSVRVLARDLGPELMTQKPTLRFANAIDESETARRLLVQVLVAPELDSADRKVTLTTHQGKHVTKQSVVAGEEDTDLVAYIVERVGCEPMTFTVTLGHQRKAARLDFVCP